MKFGFVSTMDGAPWGGSEELWSRAAMRLLQEGHEAALNVVRWPREAPQITALEERGARVRRRPSNRQLLSRVRRRFGEAIDDGWLTRERPDLLLIAQGGNLDGVEWMTRARDLKIPYATLAQMADESSFPHPSLSDPAAIGYQGSRRAFFVSRGNLEVTEMQIGCRILQGAVVFNPVNIKPGVALPTPWPADDGHWRLAAVGRLAPAAKGQDIILQVLALPKWRERPLEVSFFGDGYFKPILERLLKMLDLTNARLAGHVSRIDEIWMNHHALLLPSRHEGLPLALLEAMLCGRPAIVTNVAGNAEVIDDNQTGFVAAAPKAACLDEAMERAWSQRERWREMGAAAAARARDLLPPDPVADFAERLKGCLT